MRKLIFFLTFTLLLFSSPALVFARTEAEINQEIKDLEAKISVLQSQAQTLSGQIVFYDSQIKLTTLKITQTEDQIASLSGKIDLLEAKLQDRSKLLEKQIVQTYKKGGLDPLQIFISSDDFSDLLSRVKYLQIVQASNRKFLYDTQTVQASYAQQKDLIADSKKRLQAQKSSLANLRADRDNLLKQTKSSESNYQKLLSQAKSELASLRSFAQFKGGGILPPQPQPDGWYFNQRDERWGRNCIGNTCSGSPEYVWEVGCLITDVAMIFKKYGQDVTPLTIARNSGYFFSSTAYMLQPWPAPPGYKQSIYYGRRTDIIDSELAAGRPVVVHLQVNTSDGHFVVLKSGSGGNYIMNDPWEGPDLNFTSIYSLSNITNVSTYTRI